MRFTTLIPLLFAAFSLLACEERGRSLTVDSIPDPPVSDTINIVLSDPSASGEPHRLLAQTYNQVWIEDSVWKEVFSLPQISYTDPLTLTERTSAVWYKGYFWWIENTPSASILRRTADGSEWTSVFLPYVDKLSAGRARQVEVAERGYLQTVAEHLYYITPTHIWRYSETKAPFWIPLNLGGINLDGESGSPRFIRNYLPSTKTRPFELLTLYQDSLHVYRREQEEADFYEVSTLSSFGRELLASRDGTYLFVVAATGVYRSIDQGETWFRFWKPDNDTILTAEYNEYNVGNEKRSILLIGTANGRIYKSTTNGEQWDEVNIPEMVQRPIMRFTSVANGSSIWVATLGTGIFTSTDHGVTWRKMTESIRSSIPTNLQLAPDNSLLLLDTGGLWRLTAKGQYASTINASGSKEKGLWQHLSKELVSSFLPLDKELFLVGTIDGKLITYDYSGKVVRRFSPEPLEGERGRLLMTSDQGVLTARRDTFVFLRSRNHNTELAAWTHTGRLFVSSDQGVSWKEILIPESTYEVLREQEVIDIQLGGEKATLMLTESGMAERNLWLSLDNGQTWQQLEWSKKDKVTKIAFFPTRPAKEGEALGIIALSGGTLYRSYDMGESWHVVEGPWNSLSILQFSIYESSLVAIVDSRLGYEMVVMENAFPRGVEEKNEGGDEEKKPSFQRYPLHWPSGYPKTLPKQFVYNDDFAGILSSNRLWGIRIGLIDQSVSHAVLVVSQLLVITLLTGVVFLFLRRRIRRRRGL